MNFFEYRQSLAALNLSQVKAAHFLGVEPRTSRRWALGEAPVPIHVGILLFLMIEMGLSVADVNKMIDRPVPAPVKM